MLCGYTEQERFRIIETRVRELLRDLAVDDPLTETLASGSSLSTRWRTLLTAWEGARRRARGRAGSPPGRASTHLPLGGPWFFDNLRRTGLMAGVGGLGADLLCGAGALAGAFLKAGPAAPIMNALMPGASYGTGVVAEKIGRGGLVGP